MENIHNSSSLQSLEKNNFMYTAWGMVIIFLIISILNIINHYGEADSFVQLLYIPILISVYVFGIKGGIAAAIFSGISIQPFIILYSSTNTTKATSIWLVQILMFFVSAIIFSIIIKYYKNLKEVIKAKSYQNIQTESTNSFNLNNIINAIKYRNISFIVYEYKNIDFISSHISLVSGKKTYELIIIIKNNDENSFDEFNERIAS